MSIKDDIFKAGSALRLEPTTFFQQPVFVKAFTSAQRDAYEVTSLELNKVGKALVNVRARLVAASLVDADGKLIFGPDDVEQIGKMAADEVGRLFDLCREVHGMDDDADAKKNSSQIIPESSSSSVSQPTPAGTST